MTVETKIRLWWNTLFKQGSLIMKPWQISSPGSGIYLQKWRGTWNIKSKIWQSSKEKSAKGGKKAKMNSFYEACRWSFSSGTLGASGGVSLLFSSLTFGEKTGRVIMDTSMTINQIYLKPSNQICGSMVCQKSVKSHFQRLHLGWWEIKFRKSGMNQPYGWCISYWLQQMNSLI